MKSSVTRLNWIGVAAVTALWGSTLNAAEEATRREDDDAGKNRFTLSGRLGVGYKASFRNLTAIPFVNPFGGPSNPGPATGGAIDRDYLNGFVHVDSSGNRDDLTWNWGYSSAGQVDTTTREIAFSSVSGNVNVDNEDSPSSLPIGVELGYERHFGKLGRNPWGVYASLGWSDVNVRDTSVLQAPLDVITDRYALGNIVVPAFSSGGGYQGTFAGEGPLIGSQPLSRTNGVVFARTEGIQPDSGFRKLEATLIALKLGPSLEVPVGTRFAATFSAGLAGVWVDGEFSYEEKVIFSPDTTTTLVLAGPRTGRASRSEFEVGAYARARFGLRGTGLFVGVEYQYLPDYEIRHGDKVAKLELGQTFFFEAGVSFGF